ncbi:MAG: 16S rRNA processing protein RimM [Chloroflexi bacterium]|nr:16S rRNA processing protein RimM [Chloroflexota bacterium]|tara:strand:+ start:629 stop:1186 length:558 start_codon:yes stop_codon:yes gene_type:complete
MTGTDSTDRSSKLGNNKELVAIGRVRRPTGIKGAVLVEIYSGDLDRFDVGDFVTVGERDLVISEIGKSANTTKLMFESVDSIEKADLLRDLELLLPATELPENPPGVFYHFEIIGATVETVDRLKLGELTEILETGSNDVLVITGEREAGKKRAPEVLIPVIDGVMVSLDRENSTLIVDPPDGIL